MTKIQKKNGNVSFQTNFVYIKTHLTQVKFDNFAK